MNPSLVGWLREHVDEYSDDSYLTVEIGRWGEPEGEWEGGLDEVLAEFAAKDLRIAELEAENYKAWRTAAELNVLAIRHGLIPEPLPYEAIRATGERIGHG